MSIAIPDSDDQRYRTVMKRCRLLYQIMSMRPEAAEPDKAHYPAMAMLIVAIKGLSETQGRNDTVALLRDMAAALAENEKTD